MYNPFAYGLALTLVELPYLLAQVVLFVCICYFMVGFAASAEQFFYFFLMFLLILWFYNVFGVCIVYITPNQQLAQVRPLFG
jgi:ABC-type multidrug transport system permease subunit